VSHPAPTGLLAATLASALLGATPAARSAAPPGTPAAGERFAPLEVGDPAPPLEVAHWLRGPAVQAFEPGQVYVLDFWAVWCQPCVALLPHLSELQERLADRGVHVVAVTVPDEKDNPKQGIEALVEREAATVHLPIAYDAPADPQACDTLPLCGKTSLAYIRAALLDGVPLAFVVDGRGRVAWIGDPSALPPVVEPVAAGTWDLSDARRRYLSQRRAEPGVFELRKLVQEGRCREAGALGRTLADGPFAGHPGLLRVIANTLTRDGACSAASLDVALLAALAAVDSSGGIDAAAWSVLGRTRFLRGEIREAVAAQRHAVDLTEGRLQAVMQRRLDEYTGAAAEPSESPPD